MSSLRSDGFFTPPSLRGTLVIPGNVGGMAWGGIAHDRVNDLLIMPVNKIAAEVRLIPRDNVAAGQQAGQLSGDFEYAPTRNSVRARAAAVARPKNASAVHAAPVGHPDSGQGRDR